MTAPAGAQPARGSLRTSDGLEFRVTSRCLAEDLGLAPQTPFVEVLEGQIGAILGHSAPRHEEADLPALSRPVGLLGDAERLTVHPADDGNLLWIVAVGRDEDELRELDMRGRLWPTHEDELWLQRDTFAMWLRRLQIDAAIAASQARGAPEQPVEIAAPPPASALRVAASLTGSAMCAAILLMDGVEPDPRVHSRIICLMLVALQPDPRWTPVVEEDELHEQRRLLGLTDPAMSPAHLVFRLERDES